MTAVGSRPEQQPEEADEWTVASVRIRKSDLKAIDLAAVLVEGNRSALMSSASTEKARAILVEHGVPVPG
jgi:uncharacterized protein (DUF1778 family)